MTIVVPTDDSTVANFFVPHAQIAVDAFVRMVCIDIHKIYCAANFPQCVEGIHTKMCIPVTKYGQSTRCKVIEFVEILLGEIHRIVIYRSMLIRIYPIESGNMRVFQYRLRMAPKCDANFYTDLQSLPLNHRREILVCLAPHLLCLNGMPLDF